MTTYSRSELKQLSEYKVDRAKRFIQNKLCHVKGEWQDVPFTFIPWQEDAIEKVFGTLKPNGYRQYRFVYIEIPKKNGKSEFCSALAILGLCADDEKGAEVYCAAGDRAQASIVFNSAKYMVENNRSLSKRIKVIDSNKRMVYHQNASVYQALSKDVATKHGYNPSMVIIDELHAHKTRDLYDVLTDGTDAARRQQLVIIITTAGIFDTESIGYQMHDYAKQVKEGKIEDPTFLPIIYGIEDKDEDGNELESPDDRDVWEKVNPALNYIIQPENLEENYIQAKHNPEKWQKFCRLRLNMWVGQLTRFIPMSHWDLCGKRVYPNKLKGQPCFGGLDLGSVEDLTAFVLVFPPVSDQRKTFDIICYFYLPEESVKEATSKRTKAEIIKVQKWADQGFITATPGNSRNYGFIRKDIKAASEIYDIREIAFDRWGADEIVQDIQEHMGIEVVKHGQGFADMSAPTKDLLTKVMSHELAHDNNPVLRWCADNLATKQDASENYKPDKDKARERIDGVVALIMALGRCLANPDLVSVYEERGILFF